MIEVKITQNTITYQESETEIIDTTYNRDAINETIIADENSVHIETGIGYKLFNLQTHTFNGESFSNPNDLIEFINNL